MSGTALSSRSVLDPPARLTTWLCIVRLMTERDLSVSIPDPQARGVLVDLFPLIVEATSDPDPERVIAPADPPAAPPTAEPAPAARHDQVSPPAAAAPLVQVAEPARAARRTRAGPWCRVRVHGPSGALDVALPTTRSVGDLVAELTTRLMPGTPLDAAAWRMHRLGDPPLDPGSSFGSAAPRDGEDFHLDAAPIAEPARRVTGGSAAWPPSAERSGRWSAGSVTIAAGAGTIAASTLLSFVIAVMTPRAVAPPLLVASALLAAASRVPGSSADDAAGVASAPRERSRGVVAAAALPAWAAAGLALSQGVGGGWSSALALIGAALVIGAAASALAVPSLTRVWAGPAASGLLIAIGGTLTASGVSDDLRAAAVLGTVTLLLLASIPGVLLLVQGAGPSASPRTDGAGLDMWGQHGWSAHTAVSISLAASVSVCTVVLASKGEPSALWLAAVLAIALASRARHSRLVIESGAMLVLGLAALGYVVVVSVAGAGTGTRIAVTAVVVVALAASLAGTLLSGGAGDGVSSRPSQLEGPWRRRTLEAVEAVAALAVLPLVWLVVRP